MLLVWHPISIEEVFREIKLQLPQFLKYISINCRVMHGSKRIRIPKCHKKLKQEIRRVKTDAPGGGRLNAQTYQHPPWQVLQCLPPGHQLVSLETENRQIALEAAIHCNVQGDVYCSAYCNTYCSMYCSVHYNIHCLSNGYSRTGWRGQAHVSH